MMLQFYKNYFPDERKGIFRYMVIGHGGGFSSAAKNNIANVIEISYVSGNFQLVEQVKSFFILGRIPTQRGVRVSLGSLILHEVTHSCSISKETCNFGGIDNVSYASPILPKKSYVETWGQYRSVMNYLYTHNPNVFDLSSGDNGPPYDQNDWGYVFVGDFQYNREEIPEPYADSSTKEQPVENEWWVSGYAYDANLTETFVHSIGEWSPIDPIPVNWSVYKLIDPAHHPNARMIKVFAQPKIKTTQHWVLNREADLDPEGTMYFYSFNAVVNERMS
jgi:hypothetical protein